MKIHLAALLGAMLAATPALSADLGIKVHDFAPKMIEAMRAGGTDVTLDQPKCSISGVINCVMGYASLEIFVDGMFEGSEMAQEIVFRSKLTTPLYHSLEGMEYSFKTLQPELTQLQARRMSLRVLENLIITEGASFTDLIENFEVHTSELEGMLVVQLRSAGQ